MLLCIPPLPDPKAIVGDRMRWRLGGGDGTAQIAVVGGDLRGWELKATTHTGKREVP